MLEQDEIIEKTAARTSRMATETQPSSNDIDTIMQSMMGPPPSSNLTSTSHTQGTTITAMDIDDGPGPFDFNFARKSAEETTAMNEAGGVDTDGIRNGVAKGKARDVS